MTGNDPITAVVDQLAAHAEQITRLDTRQAEHHATVSGRLAELTEQAAAIGRVVGEHAAALTQLAATSQTAPDPDGYCPGPAPAWWKLAAAERSEPIARLRAWVEQVYQPARPHPRHGFHPGRIPGPHPARPGRPVPHRDQHDMVPTCDRVAVRVDLLAGWAPALLAAGFDETRPATWIAEGLLMYLSSSDAEQLLATITALSAPGSRFVGEYFSDPWRESDVVTSDEQERAAWNLVRQAFLYGPAGVGPADWLAGHGWTPGQVTTITELGSRHRGTFHPTSRGPVAPRVWLFDGTLGCTPPG